MIRKSILVSEMTGKLKGIQAVNTSPLDNPYCMAMEKSKSDSIVCKNCYSCRMLRDTRRNCRAPWKNNGDLLSQEPLVFVPCIDSALGRFSAHGELINAIHARNLLTIARKNPATVFGFWTKRKAIIQKLKRSFPELFPDNVIMIYSNPRTDKRITEIPYGFDKVFNVQKTDDGVNCGSKLCRDCRQCYTKDNGINVIVEKLKN